MVAHITDDTSVPREPDHRAALDEIRRQLLEKIQQRYGLSAEEAERRLRALEQEV